MNKKPFKIVCHSIQSFLDVKNMSDAELTAAYNVIKRKVEDYNDSPTTFVYMVMIAKIFLVNCEIIDKMKDEVVESDDTDAQEKLKDALEDIYFGVISLYPMFTIDLILVDVNTSITSSFMENLRDEFLPLGSRNRSVRNKSIMFSTIEEVEALKKYLRRKVIGQNDAIDTITNAIKLIGSGLEKHSSFFFLGPTGVGKTYVSKLLGKKYSGNFCKINCSEYSSPHEYSKLLGAPPGYVNSNEGGLLSKRAEKSNSWVILFDEIEKGHEKLHDLLLSLLEDGKVDDNKGDSLDFSKSIFICTFNVGLGDLKWQILGFHDVESGSNPYKNCSAKESIEKSIHEKFKDEFINRFDEWVYFNPLTEKDIQKISSLELTHLPIEKTKELLKWIADNGYSERYGARELKRFIKKNVALKVADSILRGKIPAVGTKYTPKFNDDGELEIVNTKTREENTDGMDEKKKRSNTTKERKTTTRRRRSSPPERSKGTKRRTTTTSKPKKED